MDSDKIVKLLEYITKRYDVVIGEQAIYTRLYPKDKCIFFQGNSLSEKLEKLCEKLLSKDRSLIEIANQLGYSDQSALARAYKACRGKTLLQFKNESKV